MEKVIEAILKEINKHYPLGWEDLKKCFNTVQSFDMLIVVLERAPQAGKSFIEFAEEVKKALEDINNEIKKAFQEKENK